MSVKIHTSGAGLEKLTNANRSVSTVNDRLFQVELTEIADWTSMSEYIYVTFEFRTNLDKRIIRCEQF